jgi:hypothetical protein
MEIRCRALALRRIPVVRALRLRLAATRDTHTAAPESFNAINCGGTVAVPDPYTKVFDGLGVFHQPNEFLMHLQLTYDVSPHVSFVANVANLIDSCFGGTKAAWTGNASGNTVCGYGLPGWGSPLPYGANIYNPGVAFQPEVQYPDQEDSFTAPVLYNFGVNFKM